VGTCGGGSLGLPVGGGGGGHGDAGPGPSDGLDGDAPDAAAESAPPPGPAVLPWLGGVWPGPASQQRPSARPVGLPRSDNALRPRSGLLSPFSPATGFPVLAVGVADESHAAHGLQLGPHNTFLLQMMSAPAAAVAASATSVAVASPAGDSSASPAPPRGAASASLHPTSATSAYVPVARPPRARRHCRLCGRTSCFGHSRRNRCKGGLGTVEGSFSTAPSSLGTESGEASPESPGTDADEPPPKTSRKK